MALPGPQPSSGDGAANGDMVTRCAAKGTVGWAKARAARMRGRDVPPSVCPIGAVVGTPPVAHSRVRLLCPPYALQDVRI
jgi:hypothetical protein